MGGQASKEYAPATRKVLSRRAVAANLRKNAVAEAEVVPSNSTTTTAAAPANAKVVSRDTTTTANAPTSPTHPPSPAEQVMAKGAEANAGEVVVKAAPHWSAAAMKMKPEAEELMDPTILNEMSSWSVVTSEDDKHQLKLMKEKGKEMASVIRFNEEAELTAQYGSAPTKLAGNLTEGQLFEMLKQVRDKPKTVSIQQLAGEYEIGEEAVQAIVRCARFPKLETATESIDMFVAK